MYHGDYSRFSPISAEHVIEYHDGEMPVPQLITSLKNNANELSNYLLREGMRMVPYMALLHDDNEDKEHLEEAKATLTSLSDKVRLFADEMGEMSELSPANRASWEVPRFHCRLVNPAFTVPIGRFDYCDEEEKVEICYSMLELGLFSRYFNYEASQNHMPCIETFNEALVDIKYAIERMKTAQELGIGIQGVYVVNKQG